MMTVPRRLILNAGYAINIAFYIKFNSEPYILKYRSYD